MSNIGILSIPSKTSKILAEMLGFSLIYSKNPYKSQFSTLIRWGSYATGFTGKEINTAEAIRNATDKNRTRQILREADIPVPEDGYHQFPCVGRPPTHRGGRKFFYCNNIYDVRLAQKKGASYFSPYWPKTKEYRVHVGGGKLLGIALKEGGDPKAKNWNRKKGFIFRYLMGFEWDIEIIRLAKKAIKALELDFGAVEEKEAYEPYASSDFYNGFYPNYDPPDPWW